MHPEISDLEGVDFCLSNFRAVRISNFKSNVEMDLMMSIPCFIVHLISY